MMIIGYGANSDDDYKDAATITMTMITMMMQLVSAQQRLMLIYFCHAFSNNYMD